MGSRVAEYQVGATEAMMTTGSAVMAKATRTQAPASARRRSSATTTSADAGSRFPVDRGGWQIEAVFALVLPAGITVPQPLPGEPDLGCDMTDRPTVVDIPESGGTLAQGINRRSWNGVGQRPRSP